MSPALARRTALALLVSSPALVLAQGTYMGQAEVVRPVPPVSSTPGYPAPGPHSPPVQGHVPGYPAPGYPSPAYAPAPVHAPAPDAAQAGAASFSQEELDALLAPVALYPDQLLAQVLMAATFPLDVAEAARFVQQNPSFAALPSTTR